jgi:hypothetical protein
MDRRLEDTVNKELAKTCINYLNDKKVPELEWTGLLIFFEKKGAKIFQKKFGSHEIL